MSVTLTIEVPLTFPRRGRASPTEQGCGIEAARLPLGWGAAGAAADGVGAALGRTGA
jgi:hypothetical protein